VAGIVWCLPAGVTAHERTVRLPCRISLLFTPVLCHWLTGFWLLFFFFKQKTAYEIGLGIPAEPLFRSLIMFQTFISRHNSNFFSDKLVLTSVTPASSAPVLQTPKATSSTLYFDSLTVNAGNGGFLHCIQMDTSVNAANQVVSVG